MSDDEAEMARLRQSKRYQQNRKRKRAEMEASSLKESKSPHTIRPTRVLEEQKSEDGPVIVDRSMLPTSFGAKEKEVPPVSSAHKDALGVEDETGMGEEDNRLMTKEYVKYYTNQYKLPITYEAKLTGAGKCVSCVTVERSGSRVVSGSYDNNVYMYDFGGMKSDMSYFRTATPQDGYPVIALDFNHSGNLFLCVTSSCQATVYNREGMLQTEFAKGDMYIRDMNNTLGHVMNLTGGRFWPKDDKVILTWSQDSTVRLWDIENYKKCKQVIKMRAMNTDIHGTNIGNRRLHVTACDISNDISCLAAATNNGSIQLFDPKSRTQMKYPTLAVRSAHYLSENGPTCVKFDPSNPFIMCTRGGLNDDTLKIWDLRILRKNKKLYAKSQTPTPVANLTNLSNTFSNTNIIFSPDNKMILTPTSNDKKGSIVFIDKAMALKGGMNPEHRSSHTNPNSSEEAIGNSSSITPPLAPTAAVNNNDASFLPMPMSFSVCQLLWNPRINQIFVACMDRYLRVLYSDKISNKGCLLSVARKMKKRHIDDQISYLNIINPNALREFRTIYHKGARRDYYRNLKAKRLEYRPQPPNYGVGKEGRLGTGSFTKHIMKNRSKNVLSQVDPRDALLAWDERSKAWNEWTQVYQINEPPKKKQKPNPSD